MVIVFNNGGIFHFLPIAKESDVIAPYLDTPHKVSIEHLCRAHKLDHHVINDASGFDKAIKQFYAQPENLVLEVVVDRAKNVEAHQKVYNRVAKIII